MVSGKTVLRSSTWVPLRVAARTNYVNVNRDHEFEDLSWGAMTDQAISFAFMTEICRGMVPYLLGMYICSSVFIKFNYTFFSLLKTFATVIDNNK